MDPASIIVKLITNLISKIVGFVNGLFEPTDRKHQVEAEVISAVKKGGTSSKPENLSTIKPTKSTKEVKPWNNGTFNSKPLQSVQQPKSKPLQSVQHAPQIQGTSGSIGSFGSVGTIGPNARDPYYWINFKGDRKPIDKTRSKTRIALNDDGDLIDVFHDGSSYYIE